MMPPVFETCFASAPLRALIGTSPCRLYPFGHAPEKVQKPYAVWQLITGSPENYLKGPPDMDFASVQFDVYAGSTSAVQDVVEAIRDAIQGDCYVTRWGGHSRDPETLNYRSTFVADWFVPR